MILHTTSTTHTFILVICLCDHLEIFSINYLVCLTVLIQVEGEEEGSQCLYVHTKHAFHM